MPALRKSHFPDLPPDSLSPRCHPPLDLEGCHGRAPAFNASGVWVNAASVVGSRGCSRLSVAADVEGAGVVAQVVVAVAGAPQVGAGFQGGVGPAAMGLQSMVAPAEWGEVVAGRSAAVGVGDDVVE